MMLLSGYPPGSGGALWSRTYCALPIGPQLLSYINDWKVIGIKGDDLNMPEV
jgi:hypothetical protein